MPWDGHGNFNRTSGVYTGADVWEQSRAAGRNVRSDDFDSHDEDLAEGLENCLARDGQNQPTANLPMGGKRHLNISNGQARNQYPSIAQIQDRSLTFIPASGVGGTADAITLTPSPVITAYVAGQTFTFEAEFDSTGNVTVNVSSLGAKAVYVDESQAGSEAIINGRVYDIIYDGTNFQLKGSVISAGSVVSGVLNAARIPNPGPSFIPATGVAGTGNAITLTPSPAIGAYAAGQMFTFLVKSGNTGNVTVNVSSLGAKSLGLASGEIPPDVLTADDVITIIYTGTIFHLLSISPGTAAKKSTGTASGEVALLSTGGKWTSGLIPDLDADKVASGALSTDRIPNLNASKITAGTLSSDRLPQVPQSKGGYTEYETRTSGDDHQIRFKTAENTWSAWITYETASEDCFLPGTPVLMADGGWKPVERIKIGDWVLSPMGPRQVVALDTGRTQPRVEIYVRKNGERHALRCTVNHPLALPRGGFGAIRPKKQANNRPFQPIIDNAGNREMWWRGNRGDMRVLKPGDEIQWRDGSPAAIEDVLHLRSEPLQPLAITPVTGSLVIVAGGIVASGGYDPSTAVMTDPEDIRNFFTMEGDKNDGRLVGT